MCADMPRCIQKLCSRHEPDADRHRSADRTRRGVVEAAVDASAFQTARRLRHRSAGLQILLSADHHDPRESRRLTDPLVVQAVTALLDVTEQKARSENEE